MENRVARVVMSQDLYFPDCDGRIAIVVIGHQLVIGVRVRSHYDSHWFVEKGITEHVLGLPLFV